MTEQEQQIIRVIDDIVKDRFTNKAYRILKFIKQANYVRVKEGQGIVDLDSFRKIEQIKQGDL